MKRQKAENLGKFHVQEKYVLFIGTFMNRKTKVNLEINKIPLLLLKQLNLKLEKIHDDFQ